jgi:asparagine synthetase B (glutamine-hydrolysing)
MINRSTKNVLNTIHICFGKEGMTDSERDYAEISAKHLKSRHKNLQINSRLILENYPGWVWSLDSPVTNSGWKLFTATAYEHKKLFFFGEEAETVFASVDKIQASYDCLEKSLFFLKQVPLKYRIRLYNLLELIFLKCYKSVDSSYFYHLEKFFRLKSGQFKKKGSEIPEARIRKLFLPKYSKSLTSIQFLYSKIDRDLLVQSYRYTYLIFLIYLNTILSPYYSICRNKNAEPRLPFIDLDLVTFAFKIPNAVKRKLDIDKYLLHKLSEGIVPGQICNRRKKAFLVPFDYWLRHDLKPVVDFVFSMDVVKKRGLFNYSEMKKLYDDFYLRRNVPWVDIWSFVVLEVWLREFYDTNTLEIPKVSLLKFLKITGRD